MKVMNKVIKLSWVFLALVVVGCSSSNQSSSNPSPSFNANDGGQIVFGTVDSNGRSLVLIDPNSFYYGFTEASNLEETRFHVNRGDETLVSETSPVSYYSSSTGYVQFYISNVSDGDEITVTIFNKFGDLVSYVGILQSSSASSATTTRYDNEAAFDEDGNVVRGDGSCPDPFSGEFVTPNCIDGVASTYTEKERNTAAYFCNLGYEQYCE